MRINPLSLFLGSLIALVLLVCPEQTNATSFTGTYITGGDAVDNGDGTFTLTSTPTTYSYVEFDVNEAFTFGQMTDLNVVFTSNSGGVGGGSPRLWVEFTDFSYIYIHFGPPGSFAGDDSVLNSYSGVNLLGLTDLGRYDLGGAGGLFYSDYASALALVGGKTVLDFGLVSDTYTPLADRNLTLNSINGVFTPTGAVPDQGTTLLLLSLSIGVLIVTRRLTNMGV